METGTSLTRSTPDVVGLQLRNSCEADMTMKNVVVDFAYRKHYNEDDLQKWWIRFC